MSKLQPYLASLSERIGMPLEMAPGGSFMAMLEGKRLFIKELVKSDAILFYMEVGRPTLFRRGEVLTTLMGGNLFLAETKGAALSYDALNEMVALNLILPLHHLEAEAFINAVDNILVAAEEWAQKLETLNSEAAERARQAGTVDMDTESDEQPQAAAPDMSHMLRV